MGKILLEKLLATWMTGKLVKIYSWQIGETLPLVKLVKNTSGESLSLVKIYLW